MNKTDFFRPKKEIKEMHENMRPIDEVYGTNGWVMALRRPEDFKGTRLGYINIGSNNKPIWRTIKETNPRENEKINVNGKDIKDELNFFRKSDYFHKKSERERKYKFYVSIIGNCW